MAKRPAFQFYPQDFLSDMSVQLMTPEELGAYIKLLCHDWIECGIPDDEDALARLSGARERWDSIRMRVLSCFEKMDGKLFNRRLREERKKQDKFSKEKTVAGKTGAKARWGKEKQEMAVACGCHPSANAVAMANDSSSSSSSSSSSNKRERERETREGEISHPEGENAQKSTENASDDFGGCPTSQEGATLRPDAVLVENFPIPERQPPPWIDPTQELADLFQRVCGFGGQLATWLNDCEYPPNWIRAALIRTQEVGAKAPIPYCKKILESYAAQGGPDKDERKNGSRAPTGRGEPAAVRAPQRTYQTGDKLD